MNYIYKKGYWETKNHEILKITDMETSHIKNTINFLKNHMSFYDESYVGGDLWDSDSFYYDYKDNSHLVEEKIEELELELRFRKIEEKLGIRKEGE